MARPLNCSDVPDVLEADPDIVGFGVLVAFFLTATVTILAVILAYFWNSLDESLMNGLDRKVISMVGGKWRHLKRVHTNLSSVAKEEPEAVREAGKQAVTQFILTLSDQQLVTGLAVLLAGVSDPKHLSGYEFTVVLSLAWFSSTTHLTTLTALRKYMDTHGLVRDARVVGMVIVLALIAFSLWLSLAAAGSTLPLQCSFHSVRSGFSGSNLFESTINHFAWVLVLLTLVLQYTLRIQDLYSQQRHPAFFPTILAWGISGVNTGTLTLREQFAERAAELRLQSIQKLQEMQEDGVARGVRPSRWRTRLHQSMYQYKDSFLSTLPYVGFSFTYGLTQVVHFRWSTAPELTAASYRIGFGQIMPLLLLFLPALAAKETFYGE